MEKLGERIFTKCLFFSEPFKDITWKAMNIYKTWIPVFLQECRHGLMQTPVKHGLAGTFDIDYITFLNS